jgi:hypothetical protein
MSAVPSIVESEADYAQWLRQRLPVIAKDWRERREKMQRSAFTFLRGSFFRWAERWPVLCEELAGAPAVFGVGDLHVDNFGTWRDGDGRLAWGVNDFDEATVLPYTNDLVRLCTSAILAVDQSPLQISARAVCETVLEGYAQSFDSEGAPFVVSHKHPWLHALAVVELDEERDFWDDLQKLSSVTVNDPAVRKLLANALPGRKPEYRVAHRQGGVGSLGRLRYTAIAEWQGAPVAREAKALTISAWQWRSSYWSGSAPPAAASRAPATSSMLSDEMLHRCVRSHDPSFRVHPGWIIRRLAPDARRIELKTLARRRDAKELLHAMGWETGNVHLGTRAQREALSRDLRRRKGEWLQKAVERMGESVVADWEEWKKT